MAAACAWGLGCSVDQSPPYGSLGGGGVVAATGGAAGTSSGAAGTSGPIAPPPPANGLWLLYGFEDPVTVDLKLQTSPTRPGFDVRGSGCFDGPGDLLGDPSCGGGTFADSCGPISGLGTGSSLSFAIDFAVGIGGPNVVYGANVSVSRDGTRMAGAFSTGRASALSQISEALGWIKVETLERRSCNSWVFPPADVGPLDWSTLRGRFRLQGDVAVGWLAPGQDHPLGAYRGGAFTAVTGAFGAFWNPDFHWDEGTRTVTAGPVPETVPGMPIELRMRFDEKLALTEIVATTAAGETGSFLRVTP